MFQPSEPEPAQGPGGGTPGPPALPKRHPLPEHWRPQQGAHRAPDEPPVHPPVSLLPGQEKQLKLPGGKYRSLSRRLIFLNHFARINAPWSNQRPPDCSKIYTKVVTKPVKNPTPFTLFVAGLDLAKYVWRKQFWFINGLESVLCRNSLIYWPKFGS